MATWHQLKAGLSGLFAPHATQWKVVSDEPHALAYGVTFNTESDARVLLSRLNKDGGRAFLIAPQSKEL